MWRGFFLIVEYVHVEWMTKLRINYKIDELFSVVFNNPRKPWFKKSLIQDKYDFLKIGENVLC